VLFTARVGRTLHRLYVEKNGQAKAIGQGYAFTDHSRWGHSLTLAEWRDHIAELRELAEHTSDPYRRQRYAELAQEWAELAEKLEDTTAET
jgi:hypothetical protein